MKSTQNKTRVRVERIATIPFKTRFEADTSFSCERTCSLADRPLDEATATQISLTATSVHFPFAGVRCPKTVRSFTSTSC